MLKSCSYCGGIHQLNYECPKKPKRIKQANDLDKFRWSRRWTNKRKQINERDRYMCQVCIRLLYNTIQQYNYTNIEVHHITPLVEDFSKRLDDDELICLCASHHKMAEKGEISREELRDIVQEQEAKNCL